MLTKKDFSMIEELFDQKFDEKFDEKFDQKFDEKMAPVFSKLDQLVEMVDGLAGNQRKDDEERELLSHRVSDHTDRIEKLEELHPHSPLA